MAYAVMYMPFSLKTKGEFTMLQAMLLIIIFIMGTYFGSFFTLATYRLPIGQDITHKHSYCPSCNHKLGIMDLIPVFSYLFLGAKCRYCKKRIGIRYFLFETLTGVFFVLFFISLKIDIYSITLNNIIYAFIAILYFSGLFIICGIEKEKNIIQKSVLFYEIIVSILYMIYSYTLTKNNVYEYVIYLSIMLVLIFIDSILFKKKLKYNYEVQLLMLILCITIFSGINNAICTIILAIISIGFKNILQTIIKNQKSKVIQKQVRTPYCFFLGISNIIVIIMVNFLTNYIIK